MAQKLAPAEKNSTDISAASATFCNSETNIDRQILTEATNKQTPTIVNNEPIQNTKC